MKGIILAGGSGTRLHPLSLGTSKQLMPVYDKPMIYYPLSILMLSDIRDILIITTPVDQEAFHNLLGDGSQWGLNINYCVQPSPDGLAQSFILGESFIGNDNVSLILGDNIFYGHGLEAMLENAVSRKTGATIFGYYVDAPTQYGVVTFDKSRKAINLEEKPTNPKSNYAITGLYFYDNDVINIAKEVPKSVRGEYEITDVNKVYLEQQKLNVEVLGRGIAWLDTGTHDSLLSAANYIQVIQHRQGLKIACPEEIAYHKSYIDSEQLDKLATSLMKSGYGHYLKEILENPIL